MPLGYPLEPPRGSPIQKLQKHHFSPLGPPSDLPRGQTYHGGTQHTKLVGVTHTLHYHRGHQFRDMTSFKVDSPLKTGPNSIIAHIFQTVCLVMFKCMAGYT
jgi:hypothetical protein